MQEQKHSIELWAKDDQPREKLLSKSPMALSDSELIVILINIGTKDESAVDLAKEVLLLGKNSLNELGKMSAKDLTRIKGIGEAITIAAAMELGRRRQANGFLEKPIVHDSREIAGYLQAILQDHHHEVFAVIFLNRGNRITHFEVISQGALPALSRTQG